MKHYDTCSSDTKEVHYRNMKMGWFDKKSNRWVYPDNKPKKNKSKIFSKKHKIKK